MNKTSEVLLREAWCQDGKETLYDHVRVGGVGVSFSKGLQSQQLKSLVVEV